MQDVDEKRHPAAQQIRVAHERIEDVDRLEMPTRLGQDGELSRCAFRIRKRRDPRRGTAHAHRWQCIQRPSIVHGQAGTETGKTGVELHAERIDAHGEH